jgi:hypothetical protein
VPEAPSWLNANSLSASLTFARSDVGEFKAPFPCDASSARPMRLYGLSPQLASMFLFWAKRFLQIAFSAATTSDRGRAPVRAVCLIEIDSHLIAPQQ